MKCPNCAAPSAEDAAECPKCGLVFAKWRERRDKELELLESPPAPPSRPLWVGRAIAGTVVLLWLLSLAVYYAVRLRAVSRPYGGRGSAPSGWPPGAR